MGIPCDAKSSNSNPSKISSSSRPGCKPTSKVSFHCLNKKKNLRFPSLIGLHSGLAVFIFTSTKTLPSQLSILAIRRRRILHNLPMRVQSITEMHMLARSRSWHHGRIRMAHISSRQLKCTTKRLMVMVVCQRLLLHWRRGLRIWWRSSGHGHC